ncbi:unnamed protein product [Cercopithifilaria johnstoni]|uniref:Uncharacterized protein n=1 Tax=Cercopithifilaria johnstoni TaxID=2874296 RepID=A0A8J2M1F3_9BILA|nr:unnamed protein product [Cercopithifilaria johnstoni]
MMTQMQCIAKLISHLTPILCLPSSFNYSALDKNGYNPDEAGLLKEVGSLNVARKWDVSVCSYDGLCECNEQPLAKPLIFHWNYSMIYGYIPALAPAIYSIVLYGECYPTHFSRPGSQRKRLKGRDLIVICARLFGYESYKCYDDENIADNINLICALYLLLRETLELPIQLTSPLYEELIKLTSGETCF